MEIIKNNVIIVLITCLFPSTLNSDLVIFNSKSYLPNSYIPYSGKVIEYYENSNIYKLEGNYFKGIKNGEFIFYFENGIIKNKGNFQNGLRVGSWLQFNNFGILKNKQSYDENIIYFISYYDNMFIESEGNLVNNKKNDLWIHYDENGNKVKEIFFENGEIKNVKDTFSDSFIFDQNHSSIINDSLLSNEKLQIIEDESDELIGYYDNGGIKKKDFFLNNLIHGKCSYYYESGRLFKNRFYINGKIDSSKKTIEFYESGALKSQYFELYTDDIFIKDAEFINYYENGNIKRKGLYINGIKDGKWLDYYDTGELSSERYYNTNSDSITYNNFLFRKDGTLMIKSEINDITENNNGNLKMFYESGTIMEEGIYSQGIKEKLWVEYYENGNKLSEINFVAGAGLFYSFYQTGELLKTGYYENNKKSGIWTEYYKNENIKNTIEFVDGSININKTFNTFSDNGSLLTKEFVKLIDDFVLNDGLYLEYFLNGNIKKKGVYILGVKQGKWFEYYENGSIFSEVYLDKGNGLYKSYYSSGEVLSKGSYKNDKKDGKWFKFFKNGNKSWEFNYIQDTINQNLLCYNWYESGYKRSQGYIMVINNTMTWDGPYIEYFENGVIFIDGKYRVGKREGTWKEYYNTRILRIEKNYLNGKPIGEGQFYNESGELIKIENY